MADTVTTETNSLIEFVTTNYTRLRRNVASDAPADISVKLGPVVTLIETLFATFKTLDSTHDVIVDQLKDLQTAYAGLGLDEDYPRYAAASANLTTIVVALKEDDAGSKGEGEGEEEEEEEE